VPVEQTIIYQDAGGATLETVNKAWYNAAQLQSEQDTSGSVTSQRTYSYGSGGQVTEKDEFDFGQSTATRKTISTYQSFTSTPIYSSGPSIFDRPCKTVVYDSSGKPAAETDYLYDGGTTVCGTATTASLPGTGSYTSHDETNYGTTATAPRGNLTTETRECFIGSTACTNAVTTYKYDETGQVSSVTDPKSGITQYSFADNYQSGSGTPPGSTNAYLTTVTYPTVNGVTQHKYFQYAYSDGQLTQSQDDNQKASSVATNYVYNDNLRRLTETDYPDGGQTTVSYNDTAPSPSVTTSKLIDSTSNVRLGSTAVMDGMGHVVQTQLTSDPDTADYVDTTYDGVGGVKTRSNPHRTSGATTDGTTSYTYDALGRTIRVDQPDGSFVTTSYSGNQTITTDEVADNRRTYTDGLGRLTRVDEPIPTALPTPASATITISDTGIKTSTQPATPGTGNFAVYGTYQQKVWYCPAACFWVPDQGNLLVSVNGGTPYSAPFSQTNNQNAQLAQGWRIP
jgi:YD repeat-containing protein